MSEIDYEDVLNRISGVYSSCSMMEQKLLKRVLQEVVDNGYSRTLEQLWLVDFKEVPVSISEFISSPLYMGPVTRNGDAVYPFWKKTLKDLFDAGNKYNEIIFSGATRIGKTSTAVAIAAYMLYRLMLYRNPHEYFKKKEVSKFTLAFANLTRDLAAGVAYREFFDTLKECPWFQEHGRFNRSERNFVYYPEGDKIEIIPASDSAHVLGMQLWLCLTGDTVIATADGPYTLQSLEGKSIKLPQLSDEGNIVHCFGSIVKTTYTDQLFKIVLSNGSVIQGTADHRLLLADGCYQALKHLRVGQSLVDISHRFVFIQHIEILKLDRPIAMYDVVNAGEYHNFFICCKDSLIVSHNCFMDEVNFARAGIKDINIAKQHMKSLYDTANARITGTFKIRGEVYGKLLVCSSKNSDSDFLSGHIENQLDAGNTSMYLIDRPQWEVLPQEMFSDETFFITVGDRYKRGFVIPKENEDEEHFREYESQGYELLEVPLDFLPNFRSDYDIALRDIAGRSVVGAMGFITQESITPCVAQDRQNPFFNDVIIMGTHDNETLERNFHLDVVPAHLKRCPNHIHIDFAEVSDHIGISSVCQDGTKIIVDRITEKKIVMPFYRQVFQIEIEAPRGDRMSFQKVINFIVWLRRNGFNIDLITTDQYQSSYVRETLNQQGFETDKISVDKSEDPYIGLRNLLQDQRIELVKHQLQEDELVHLQRINGRIDHPPQGTGEDKGIGKDGADALCGAVWSHIMKGDKLKPSSQSIAKSIASVNGRNAKPHIATMKDRPSIMQSPYVQRRR